MSSFRRSRPGASPELADRAGPRGGAAWIPTARPRVRRRVHRQELQVAPDPGGAALDRRAAHLGSDGLGVVGDLERAEARGADEAGSDGLRAVAVPAAESQDPGPARRVVLDAGRDRRGHHRPRRDAGVGRGRLGRHGSAPGRWARALRGSPAAWLPYRGWPGTKKPFPQEEGFGSDPYLAGGCPARNWHLAGVAAGRLSWLQRAGPSTTLDRLFSCGADGTGRPVAPSRSR